MKPRAFFAASAVFFLLLTSLPAAIPPAERLLPEDTLMMVTVPDCAAMRASAQQSPQWLLWNDPAMQPFREDFMAKWNDKFVGPLQKSLGIQISDYLPLLQGQLTFAITQNGWNGSDNVSPALLFLLDAGNKGNLLATNLAALKQKWLAAGRPVRTQSLEGIQFTVVTLSSNAPVPFSSVFARGGGGAPASPTVYIAQYKSLLIAGTSVQAAASVAAHLTGGADPSLSQDAQFAADQLAQFHGGPLYYGWFNASAVFKVLSQAKPSEDSSVSPFSWNNILLASGLRGLKSVSFSYRESHEGAQIEFYAAVPESSRQGLLKIISAAPQSAAPPPFVPIDAVKFWRWRVDGQKSWAEIQKTLAAVSPTAVSTLNSFLDIANATAQQRYPNFDIRKDLIGNLGDDWMSYSMPPAGKSLSDLKSAPSLFLFGASHADQAVLALKTLVGMNSQTQASSRDFLGRKIYTISLPTRRSADDTAGGMRSIYFTASGGYVAISSDISMIEGYLRSDDGKTRPLSQRSGLIAAAQHVGGMGNGLFGYQNQRESAEALFAALKNDPAVGSAVLNPLAALPFASAGNGISDLMNFSLLPDYGAISKYFNFTVYGGSATAEGLDVKFFSPRPPELN